MGTSLARLRRLRPDPLTLDRTLAALLTVVAELQVWLGGSAGHHRVAAALIAAAVTASVAVRRRPVIVGPNRVVGEDAVVRTPGQVFVAGELWRARRDDGEQLVPGEHVRVKDVQGLELTVE